MVAQSIVLLGHALEFHQGQRKGIADGQHHGNARARGEAKGTGFLDHSHVEHHVREIPQRRIRMGGNADDGLEAQMPCQFQHLDDFTGFATGGEGNDAVACTHQTKIAVGCLGRMDEVRRGGGGAERGRELVRHVAGLADTGGEDLAAAVVHHTDSALERVIDIDGRDRAGFGGNDLAHAGLNVHGGSGGGLGKARKSRRRAGAGQPVQDTNTRMHAGHGLLPRPRRLEPRWGRLELGSGLLLEVGSEPARAIARRYQQRFDRLLGAPTAEAPTLRVEVQAAGPQPAIGDDEQYRLRITASGGELGAATPWGAVHGLERCLQLLQQDHAGAFLPALLIDDGPRMPWRGLLLDLARHFFDLPTLLRTLDGMAAAGLNVLHLHLNDDQGFRFESRRCPRLHERAGVGGYLRVGEIAALVEAAAARGIRIVPELDVPGHAGAILFAHPELAAGPAPATLPRAFGPSRYALDPSLDATWGLLEAVVDDLVELFPDDYVHLGGDEVHPEVYAFADDRRRAWMAAEGLADPAAVQAWFTRGMVGLLANRGRRVIGWDETLHPGMPEGMTVQAWRGASALEAALDAGHDALYSAGWYLDLSYPARLHYGLDPGAPAAELAAAEAALARSAELADVREGVEALQAAAAATTGMLPTAPERGRLLGGEACLWAELVTAELLDVRLYGRLAAVAERLWSNPLDTDVASFEARLPAWLTHIERVTDCRPLSGDPAMLWRLGVAPEERTAVEALFEALEPVRWYKRLLGIGGVAARQQGRTAERPYDADTRLDRPVDQLAPDSIAMFVLRRALFALTADPNDSATLLMLRDFAGRWRMLPARLASLQARSDPFAALTPRIEQLAELAELLDELLDQVVAREPPGMALRQRFDELARTAAADVAETELAALRPIAAWLESQA